MQRCYCRLPSEASDSGAGCCLCVLYPLSLQACSRKQFEWNKLGETGNVHDSHSLLLWGGGGALEGWKGIHFSAVYHTTKQVFFLGGGGHLCSRYILKWWNCKEDCFFPLKAFVQLFLFFSLFCWTKCGEVLNNTYFKAKDRTVENTYDSETQTLKEVWLSDRRFSASGFFHESLFPGHLSIPLGPFWMFNQNSRRYSQLCVRIESTDCP